ncbi:TIR domain-containing protein [Cryptosporangium aurantiacum]|uniref:Predicted nucleotide-binding protein containing TIR-like domain-containing protein n=1 Tax=Cryptosporangium aurantiacum TaxID=134849 RepID=A0A1M7RDS6_9ACTN|nr:TIR domain-containing protein [Cryptosporangium aurantiacum]SHN44366.1 Predicted nucleotide-binding protein containing TIR-like domain-containing protein [Cryptosporangium aurantiacum]
MASLEGDDLARAAQINLDDDCEVATWRQAPSALSQIIIGHIEDWLRKSDFCLIIMTADDQVRSRGRQMAAMRNNLLLEIGMSIGIVGRERTILLCDRNNPPVLPTDLGGITVVTFAAHSNGNYAAALGAPCSIIRSHLLRLGPREVH